MGSISSRIDWYCALRFSAGTATDFGGTVIGDHSFDASFKGEACSPYLLRTISLHGDIGRRTLWLCSICVNGDCIARFGHQFSGFRGQVQDPVRNQLIEQRMRSQR